jgi:hypothetical protein
VLLAAGLAVPPTRVLLTAEAGYVVLGGLVLVETALYATGLYASFLVENTNSKVLTLTSGTAVVSLAATAVAAALLVPPLGPVGGFAALVVALAVKAAVLRRLLRRRNSV